MIIVLGGDCGGMCARVVCSDTLSSLKTHNNNNSNNNKNTAQNPPVRKSFLRIKIPETLFILSMTYSLPSKATTARANISHQTITSHL